MLANQAPHPMAEQPTTDRQTVRLYWNHICILHNYEKQYLARLTERLAEQGIDLEVTFFGLGYATHMAEYLAQDDAVLPDMIVTADLEVVEHPRVAQKLTNRHACESWMALKDTPAVRAVRRDETLLPVVVIPIVLYGADCTGEELGAIARERRLAFGGINNSAGKTVTKAIWARYGCDEADAVLQRSQVTDMPIGAFQAVRTGSAEVALVPSLYAMRSDGVTTHESAPAEGPLLLPSYLLACETVPEEVARTVARELLSSELLGFYVTNGDLIACAAAIEPRSRYEDADPVWALDAVALAAIDVDELYDHYCAQLPTATRL